LITSPLEYYRVTFPSLLNELFPYKLIKLWARQRRKVFIHTAENFFNFLLQGQAAIQHLLGKSIGESLQFYFRTSREKTPFTQPLMVLVRILVTNYGAAGRWFAPEHVLVAADHAGEKTLP
jgi:hypothetical protein